MRVIVSLFALLVACVIAHDIEGANLVPFTTSEAIVERWLETGRPVFVAHTASWSAHCKHFVEKVLVTASQELTSIDWMNIDCTGSGEEHCNNLDIKVHPTLKYFTGAWHDYEGERTVEALADLVESIKDLKEVPVQKQPTFGDLLRLTKQFASNYSMKVEHEAKVALNKARLALIDLLNGEEL